MNRQALESAIKHICDAVVMQSDHSYTIHGKPFQVAYQQPYMEWNKPLHHFGQNEGDENQMKLNLTHHLTGSIYSIFYCSHGDVEDSPRFSRVNEPIPPVEERDAFMDRLSKANHTRVGIDPFWTVYSQEANGASFVTKNGQVRQLITGTFLPANPSDPSLKLQSAVHLKIEKENREVQPSFYHVFSEELVSQQAQFIRIYFHIKPEGSEVLVDHLTALFNAYRIPFSFKCLNHPDLYDRSDSAVLYVDKIYSRLSFVLLKKILIEAGPYLNEDVPLFTKKLAGGVSFAEDPGAGQSFGMSRSTLLAEGLLSAYEKKMDDAEEKTKEVLTKISKSGLDLDHIYLRPNSKFPYEFSVLY